MNIKAAILLVTLLFLGCAQDEKNNNLADDHGDTQSQATVIQNSSIAGTLGNRTDIDVFLLTEAGHGLERLHSVSSVPVYISIRNQLGETLVSHSYLSINQTMEFSYGSGDYYIFVESAEGYTGTYGFNLSNTSYSGSGLIYGTLKFEDQKPPALSGGNVLHEDKAASYVHVQVVDSYGSIRADGLSDAYGGYQFNLPLQLNGASLYVRMLSEGTRSATYSVAHDASGMAYAVAGNNFIFDANVPEQQNLVATANNFGAAFNIIDNIVSAQDLLLDTLQAAAVPNINVLWYAGNSNGTYFDALMNRIYLYGLQSDNDGYDDAVILHEYGHFVLSNFSRDDSPGGMHTLTDTQQELSLAWSEGWATAWSCYVRMNRGDSYPEQYLDSDGAGTYLIEYEVEHVTQQGNLSQYLHTAAMGMANEIAISSVIWDILDLNQENHDVVYDPQAHWRTLLSLTTQRRVAMQDFIDIWNNDAFSPDISPLLMERSMYLLPDMYEVDDVSPSFLALGETQQHTFHFLADTDWQQVDLTAGQVYSFETLNLLSGADTVLSIYDAPLTTANLLASNDDRCGTLQTCLDRSSLIVYSPMTTASYYLQVKRYLSPTTYNRHGSYELKYNVLP